jgi:hypothetical protein
MFPWRFYDVVSYSLWQFLSQLEKEPDTLAALHKRQFQIRHDTLERASAGPECQIRKVFVASEEH